MKKSPIDKISKKVPFEVPNEYFAQLKSDIQTRVSEKESIQMIPQSSVRWAFAATVAAIVTIFIFYPSTTKTPDQLLAEVGEQDLIEYLEASDISEYEVLEGLDGIQIDLLLEDESLNDFDLESTELDELLLEYENDFENYL